MAINRYLVGGYATNQTLPTVTAADAGRLTHLFVSFAVVVDGAVSDHQITNAGEIARIRSLNPDLRIILSIGGWGAGGFSEAAADEAGRRRFAETAAELVRKHSLDGVDIDWEYPCYSEASIASSPNDKRNFTLLLMALRDALASVDAPGGRGCELTIAVGADAYFIDGTEMDKVAEIVDYVNVMTYDMRGGFQTLTGHHTCLYTSTGDLFRISGDASLRLYERAGVPRSKMVLGAAFYTRRWTDVPNVNNGLFQMTPGSGKHGPRFGDLDADYIGKNGFSRYWDDEAKAPYLFDGATFLSYDDEESLRHKSRYVRDGGYAGIFYWEHGCDGTRRLLQTISDELNGTGER